MDMNGWPLGRSVGRSVSQPFVSQSVGQFVGRSIHRSVDSRGAHLTRRIVYTAINYTASRHSWRQIDFEVSTAQFKQINESLPGGGGRGEGGSREEEGEAGSGELE